MLLPGTLTLCIAYTPPPPHSNKPLSKPLLSFKNIRMHGSEFQLSFKRARIRMSRCVCDGRQIIRGVFFWVRSLIFTASYQFLALAILESLIKTRWKALPPDQKQGWYRAEIVRSSISSKLISTYQSTGIRNFIVQTTVEVTSDEPTMRRERAYVNKLNIVLVNVSWTRSWRPCEGALLCLIKLPDLPVRSSNKHGLMTGPSSSPKSSLHQRPTSLCVRTIWSSSSYSPRRSSTFQPTK